MSISKIELNAISSQLKVDKSDDVSAATSVEKGAHVKEAHLSKIEFSEHAKILTHAIDAVKSAPEINLGRIEELKAAIANGSYKIDSIKLADKMLMAHLRDQ